MQKTPALTLFCVFDLSPQMQMASDEYYGAEIEVLADAKKDIPPSSSAGAPLLFQQPHALRAEVLKC